MADRNRDRHIRDSGLPTNDDSLITIAGGDQSSDELIRNFFNPTTPAPSSSPLRSPSPPNMAQAVPPGQVRPQQIANIPLFDGERGEGFVNWIETLENTRDAYDWPIDSLVGIAKSRGGPHFNVNTNHPCTLENGRM